MASTHRLRCHQLLLPNLEVPPVYPWELLLAGVAPSGHSDFGFKFALGWLNVLRSLEKRSSLYHQIPHKQIGHWEFLALCSCTWTYYHKRNCLGGVASCTTLAQNIPLDTL